MNRYQVPTAAEVRAFQIKRFLKNGTKELVASTILAACFAGPLFYHYLIK